VGKQIPIGYIYNNTCLIFMGSNPIGNQQQNKSLYNGMYSCRSKYILVGS